MCDLRAVFARDGPLARSLPGFEPRPEQERMAAATLAALDSGRHLLVEAGTGVGKSFAYLVPAVLWATRGTAAGPDERRIVISTHTRALQEQLVRKDLPVLQRALEPLGIAFRHALLMGAENYLCVQRLAEALAAGEDLFDPRETAALRALARYAETGPTGLRSGIPMRVPDRIWSRVRRERDICLGPRGPFWESCLYRRDLARSREAHLLIVNHALFLLDLAAGGWILPPHGAAILDEAHRLEEVACAQLGASVSDRAVARLRADAGLRDGTGRRGGWRRARRRTAPAETSALRSAVERVDGEARLFFEEVRREAAALLPPRSPAGGSGGRANGPGPPVRLTRPGLVQDRLRAPLLDLEEELDAAGRKAPTAVDSMAFGALAARARDLRERLTLFLTQSRGESVYWVEPPPGGGGGATLRMAPVEVAPTLRQRLFEGARSVVLTSATLTAAGSFAHLRRRLGITAAEEIALGSPFDFRSQVLLYLPPTMPDPAGPPGEYARAVVDECRRLLLASDGGAFILFTSYALLNRVHDSLRRDPALEGMPLFRHERGAASSILDAFRSTRRGVLLGTLTFWQGVDVAGEALRCVILTRLPFEVPDHPLAQARAELLRGRGLDPFTEDALPDAILTFRQGFGRLIRSREDRGLVAVLDPRLLTRAYGAAFLESLPPCPRTDSMEKVRRFCAGDRGGA
ncbi:MAG: ATP-dependent DNA helicase [Acidobacteriota bacterium]